MDTAHAHVGYTTELLEQVAWQESDDRVLGSDNLIRWVCVFFLVLPLVVPILLW